MQNFKPILFSTAMVQAILEDRKTQTRRVIKPQPVQTDEDHWQWAGPRSKAKKNTGAVWVQGKNVSPADDDGLRWSAPIAHGTILWVRETWQYSDDLKAPYLYKQKEQDELKPEFFKRMTWKPSIFMPKEACRIFLEVTNVRVERLQDISEEDAISEGIDILEPGEAYKDYIVKNCGSFATARGSFFSLWHSINGEKSFKANPWVWVYDFKRIEKPEDFL